MKRLINLILLCCLSMAAFGQQKPPVDRSIANQVVADRQLLARYFFNIPRGASPAFPSDVPDSLKTGSFYWKTSGTAPGLYLFDGLAWVLHPDLTSVMDSISATLPAGLKGQIMKASKDNSNVYTAYDPVIQGKYIDNDEQLNAAKSTYQSAATIFKTWKRFSHGGVISNPPAVTPSNDVPTVPLLTNSWAYDSVANKVTSTFNSGSHIGFISNNKYLNYVHTATLTSSDSDNDVIGMVMAYVEDASDLVPNIAYGSDPALFNWGINTTDAYIPQQHTLTAFRNREGATNAYFIVYDWQKLTQKVIVSKTGTWTTTSNWAGATVDLQVSRDGDNFVVKTTDFSDAPGGKGALRYEIDLDLNSDPVLQKFRGPASYGYSIFSQANSSWTNVSFSVSENNIYDLRNGNVWVPNSSGVYSVDSTRNLYNEVIDRSLLFNPTTKVLYYTTGNPAAKYVQLNDAYASLSSFADTTTKFVRIAAPNQTIKQRPVATNGFIMGDTLRAALIYGMGTSITRATNSANVTQPDSSYLARLGKMKGIRWTNRGLSGRTLEQVTVGDSSGYSQRYSIGGPTSPSDIYMIELRVNDAFGDSTIYNPSAYRVQLDSMVVAAHKKGWAYNRIWIHNTGYYNPTTLNPTAPNTEYRNSLFAAQDAAEAASRGTLYSDNFSAMKTAWQADASLYDSRVLHPTNKGHALIARLDSAYLTTVIPNLNFDYYLSKVIGSLYVYGYGNFQGINVRNNAYVGNNLNVINDVTAGRDVYINGSLSQLSPLSTDKVIAVNSTTHKISAKNLYAPDVVNIWGARQSTGTLDFNDATNTVNGFSPTLLRGSTALNAPNSTTAFWHVWNIENGTSKDGTGNITQIAIPYADASALLGGFYWRSRLSGTWSAWKKIVQTDATTPGAGAIAVGTGSGDYAVKAISGDATLAATGALTIGAAKVGLSKLDTAGMHGKYVDRGKITWPGAIFNTPTTAAFLNGGLNFSPVLNAQNANNVLAGPSSGSAATPVFRALVGADVASAGTAVLSKFASFNAKDGAIYGLYQVPTGKSLVVAKIIVVCTAATSISSPASINVYNSTPVDIIPTTTMTGLTTVGSTYTLTPQANSIVLSAGDMVRFNMVTPATGTSQAVDIYLLGTLL